ncbi:MAG: trypsin-like peptidase domain-containing protein [Cyclobacteriaceae bacterium]
MALLTQQEVIEIAKGLVHSGVDTLANRPAFFQSIDIRFFANLARNAAPMGQMLSDLGTMNIVERLADGQIPMLAFLNNAVLFLSGMPQEAVVNTYIDKINRKGNGIPALDVAALGEIKEKIIHRNDMVLGTFLSEGLAAATSVMKLLVPSYKNGVRRKTGGNVDLLFNGTGWMFGNSLIMTNHHVVNARMDGEALASSDDLHVQAAGTTAEFDFDSKGQAGQIVKCVNLEAWDATLDYALVRAEPTARIPLRLAVSKVVIGQDPFPVNIIQHPNGSEKKFAIRNNLVNTSNASELQYFTDTESGSSGSPVFDDKWRVVALHRGSVFVNNVQFQGKNTAFVNIGTHINSILSHMKTNFKAVYDELNLAET